MDTPLLTSPASASLYQPPKTYTLTGSAAVSLAICQADFEGARALMDLILLCEPMNHVDLVLSVAGGPEIFADQEREWFDFHAKATSFFRKVEINRVRDVRPMSTQAEGSLNRDWRPNNNMFRAVADYFQHFRKDVGAFYYLEPDCAILKRDWFSQMLAQYKIGQKPFMGVIRQAKRTDGSMLPRHMNGSGWYPNPVVRYSEALYAASMNQHPEAAPFDVAGGVTVTPRCQSTKLICVDFNANPDINPEAVVWHGDKRNQMKYSMIEKFGGAAPEDWRLQEGSGVITSPDRPHFQNTPTDELKRMSERIVTPLVQEDDDFLSDGPAKVAAMPVEALQQLNQNAARVTPPKNAYEAYLRAMNSFGVDVKAWNAAVIEYKTNGKGKDDKK